MSSFFEIPVSGTTVPFSQHTELGGIAYTLLFHYNHRDGVWRLNLTGQDGELLANLKLVNGIDLLAQFRYKENMPQNKLIVHDLDGQDRDAGANTFGDRVLLMYEED